jgi:hypothetical protein
MKESPRRRVLLVRKPRFASRLPRSQPIQASRAAHFHAAFAEQRAAHRPSRAFAHQIPDVLAYRVAMVEIVIAAKIGS